MLRRIRLLMLLLLLPAMLRCAAQAELYALGDLLTDGEGTVLARAEDGLFFRTLSGDGGEDLFLEGDGSLWAVRSLSRGRLTDMTCTEVSACGNSLICRDGAGSRYLTPEGTFDDRRFCSMTAAAENCVLALEGDANDDISDRLVLLNEDGSVSRPGIAVINGLGRFSEDLLALCDGRTDRWGYIGTDGQWFLSPVYLYAGPFRDGAAVVADQGGYGVIGKNGEMLFPCVYDLILRTESAACLIRGDRVTICSASFSPAAEANADGCSVSLEGDVTILSDAGHRTLLGPDGAIILQTDADTEVSLFGPERILLEDGSGWQISDRSGHIVSGGTGSIRILSDTLAATGEPDGSLALRDTDGTVVEEGIRGRVSPGDHGSVTIRSEDTITVLGADASVLFTLYTGTDAEEAKAPE